MMTDDAIPLAVTVPQACRLSGYGPTTIWALVRDGRLRAVRVPGIRRTLVAYDSLRDLLMGPASPQPRRGGWPGKNNQPRESTL